MKNFFIKLDKNFFNLIAMFIITLIETFVIRKYNISLFDNMISFICIGLYLRICDNISDSFKK